jgi:hypothetical protein
VLLLESPFPPATEQTPPAPPTTVAVIAGPPAGTVGEYSPGVVKLALPIVGAAASDIPGTPRQPPAASTPPPARPAHLRPCLNIFISDSLENAVQLPRLGSRGIYSIARRQQPLTSRVRDEHVVFL